MLTKLSQRPPLRHGETELLAQETTGLPADELAEDDQSESQQLLTFDIDCLATAARPASKSYWFVCCHSGLLSVTWPFYNSLGGRQAKNEQKLMLLGAP